MQWKANTLAVCRSLNVLTCTDRFQSNCHGLLLSHNFLIAPHMQESLCAMG